MSSQTTDPAAAFPRAAGPTMAQGSTTAGSQRDIGAVCLGVRSQGAVWSGAGGFAADTESASRSS